MCLSLICVCVRHTFDVHLDGPMEWGVCVYHLSVCACVTHLMSIWMDLWSGECVFITYLCVRRHTYDVHLDGRIEWGVCVYHLSVCASSHI